MVLKVFSINFSFKHLVLFSLFGAPLFYWNSYRIRTNFMRQLRYIESENQIKLIQAT
jgi:hypothetical protein